MALDDGLGRRHRLHTSGRLANQQPDPCPPQGRDPIWSAPLGVDRLGNGIDHVCRDMSDGYKVDVSRGERVGRVSSEWVSFATLDRFTSITNRS
ncbi:hypothetical protein IE4872_PD01339 (plasmid) [Rhizobium gallicum]|uniref:Uncharacterized protein n=1 Tax=Rhizobium gallicum TaxID=56730 RepID=A0A1L5NVE7_9HYPH|nr:hypothetical protein IE4872_PD01339 [Rhizobium gallicum]